MKKITYYFIGLYFTIKYNHIFATECSKPLGLCKIENSKLKNGNLDLLTSVDNILGYLTGLLYFISVVIGLYGGFLILVSGGDDEKVKKGKNFIIYMIIGLILIFLASIIVNWIIVTMTDKT